MQKRPFEERFSLPFWDEHPPDKRDALLVLMRTLDLLSEALPLALAHIGTCDCKVQETFWRSFMEFDRRTDITWRTQQAMASGEISAADYAAGMGQQMEEWREIVESLISPLRKAKLDKPAAAS